ncbi:MAG: D-amino-acid transaminase [Alphaproteobacteria bacterium]|nr:D-amino-acid transaminase [Alphaproteobacteria bacterium]
MTRVVYVNGRYLPYADANVHVEDRGFQFADSVYEVIEIAAGGTVDATRHLDRLQRSLSELSIQEPMSRSALCNVLAQVIRRNRVTDGLVYMQVSRGTAPRDFPFTGKSLTPTLVCLARSLSVSARDARASRGIRVVTMPDIRWARCDIKTVMLLPAILAKEKALSAGADEAWLIDGQGFVTEGASSNAWIVNADDNLQTRDLSNALLPGVTRATTVDMAAATGRRIVFEPFSIEQAMAAREAFTTSASGTIMPVVAIDGKPIGSGRPGPVATSLRRTFHNFAERRSAC